MRFLCLFSLLFLAGSAAADDRASLARVLRFHASFDTTADADVARGDPHLYTAKSLQRESVQAGMHSDAVTLLRDGGRHGGALAFSKKSDQVVFFKGHKNVPAVQPSWQGSLSFWLQVTPDADLPPGYVDPLQITDKKWNDASFFVDFTKEMPRKFRLGVFSDYAFWNPSDRKWDDIPDAQRPLVTVDQPPFARDRWTHVGITFRDFNADGGEGVATLYLNGTSQGELRRPQRLSWGQDRLAIMLGIYYVGRLDDFAIFDRALTAAEMKQVFQLPEGIKSLTAGAR